MKKSLILLSLLVLATLPLSAQRIRSFLSAGGTLSQIEGDELKGFTKLGFTAGVGALATLDRQDHWKLSVEALFSQRGCYNATSDPFSLSMTLNYVDVPLMFHYHDPWGGMLIGVGLCYSRLVQQPHSTLYYNKDYFYPDTNDFDFLKNDLGVVVDFRFPIWKKLLFNIRWQYSLIAIKRDWHFKENDGLTPVRDSEGNPIVNPDGSVQMETRWREWDNDCQNNSLTFRLIWQF